MPGVYESLLAKESRSTSRGDLMSWFSFFSGSSFFWHIYLDSETGFCFPLAYSAVVLTRHNNETADQLAR